MIVSPILWSALPWTFDNLRDCSAQDTRDSIAVSVFVKLDQNNNNGNAEQDTRNSIALPLFRSWDEGLVWDTQYTYQLFIPYLVKRVPLSVELTTLTFDFQQSSKCIRA